MSDNGPSKTTIADYLELDGAGAEFLDQFDNGIDNRGLPGSNVDLGPGWAYGLAAPLRLMKGLYDLTSDPGETTDLSMRFPDRVKQLSDRWSAYASENGVVEPDEPVAYAKPPG